ncbi:MAG: excinuclease ABC subunit UvrC [Flavobacteriales bacterium AspAUS03]
MNTQIESQLKDLPTVAGVYQYYDRVGRILYIGKAKDLKKRVSYYFHKNHSSGKMRALVNKIARIEYLVVDNEYDALLLENSLIKKHSPPYNIRLKDDKSYPWICIKNELFPRVFLTRQLIKDGSEYYGPYTSVKTAQGLLELITELHPLRSCRFDLSPEKIQTGKYKVCLEYHIKNCKGPCEGLQSESDYQEDIKFVRRIIRGNFQEPLRILRERMDALAQALYFEGAQKIKEKIARLTQYQARSTVINPSIENVDIFTIVSDEDAAYVNFLKVIKGAIVQSYTSELAKKLDETDETLLEAAIMQIRDRFQLTSKEIYLPMPLELKIPGVKITVFKIGNKRKIIELSERHARYYHQERLKQINLIDPDMQTNRLMQQAKADLRLPEEPHHIECFDNSNIQGAQSTSACVVFKDGKPNKKDYRKFNVKTVEGSNDFATIQEVVYRRYKRLLDTGESLPQLIVIDGGKGQLNAAFKSLKSLDLQGKIAILSIAKRLEEIFFPDDPIPLYLDKNSETLKLIQYLRNEAHRFSLLHHRDRRSKQSLSTEIGFVSGIGEKTITTLLRHFKSLKQIRESSFKALESIVGRSRAEKIVAYFREGKV